ncbi:MAG: TRAP transporter small permease subunit [Hasllibacter sp.]
MESLGLVGDIVLAPWNILRAILSLPSWIDWGEGENLMRFIYYGASSEFIGALIFVSLALIAGAVFSARFGWGVVRGLEGFANVIGRTAAWAGLLMVLQQILIVLLQRIFRVADITVGPFGYEFTQDISWFAEELKFYNAIVVTLCVTWTFVQGGHVRVDLVYSAVSHRAKRAIDMVGSVIFMAPMALLIYYYAWFFLWRHLITPNVSASDTLDRMLAKARAVRWNVETIGFSPNGFNAYFLFKVLLVTFAALVFVQAVAFFIRSFLEFREGEESANKYLDRDVLGDEDAELAAEIH